MSVVSSLGVPGAFLGSLGLLLGLSLGFLGSLGLLGDSICQGEVLQALMKRSRDQVLTVMYQDAHSKGYYAALAMFYDDTDDCF